MILVDEFLCSVKDKQFKLIQNLIKKRIENNLTQRDISDITGLSQQAISRMEKHGHTPSLTNLIKYLTALNMDINDLFK